MLRTSSILDFRGDVLTQSIRSYVLGILASVSLAQHFFATGFSRCAGIRYTLLRLTIVYIVRRSAALSEGYLIYRCQVSRSLPSAMDAKDER